MTQGIGLFALILSTVCLLSAQQVAPESSPVFSSEAKMVLIPFSVVRGTRFAADLKREDVLLHEDGKPRDFSIFEAPATRHLSHLELVLLFDTTTLSEVESQSHKNYSRWNRQATYDFTGHWGDVESRALLQDGLADVRISVYRFDHRSLQRLCRSTSDPGTLTNAIHRLPEPIPAGEAIPLRLPPKRQTYEDAARERGLKGDPKNPSVFIPSWSMEAVIDTLRDSAAAPDNGIRVLVAFSQGAGPTTTQTHDAADQAIALGIPVFPVVLDFYKYYRTPVAATGRTAGGGEGVHTFPPVAATAPPGGGGVSTPPTPSGACVTPDGRGTCYGLTLPLEKMWNVGALTGGRGFYPYSIDEGVVSSILKLIRNESLSQYVVGFVPPAPGRRKKHNLEIRLQSKSSGKLRGGKKTAVY
jgi:hypothetical protein